MSKTLPGTNMSTEWKVAKGWLLCRWNGEWLARRYANTVIATFGMIRIDGANCDYLDEIFPEATDVKDSTMFYDRAISYRTMEQMPDKQVLIDQGFIFSEKAWKGSAEQFFPAKIALEN